MTSRERLATIGAMRGQRLAREFGEELRMARMASGLTQRALGLACGVSKSTVSRIERALPPLPDFVIAATLARLAGLDLSIRCFPAPGRLRDQAQLALIGRFMPRLAAAVARRLEAPVKAGDLRAWDLLLRVGGETIGVAAETRIRDLQALLRQEHRKQEDGGVDRLLLLVAETRHNRLVLAEHASLLVVEFPLRTRTVLGRLSQGRSLGANGLVVL
jgi:transcriptional regulator with XRE-family HTH domain